MDQLANQLSNVSLYDVKKYVRKAQNAVLNFSEMEALVREATNNEPWGTPTTKMQQIADATNSYQHFHEIMPFIYRRFTEKSASEWRQIYKSLQLLDYLVHNGSERVVDYARSHISVIEMLRHFSYIDSKGHDQGMSIRQRASDLVQLLGSKKRLRAERKEAKDLHAKTLGSSYGSGGGGFAGTGNKYGGISSEAYRQQARHRDDLSQQFYGDGGGFDGSNNIVAASSSSSRPFDSDEFEEYEVDSHATSSRAGPSSSSHAQAGWSTKAEKAENSDDDDDDFADFQTAPTSTPANPPKSANANILDLFDAPVAAPPASSKQPSLQNSTSIQSSSITPSSPPSNTSAAKPTSPQAAARPGPSVDLFDSLWETSKTTINSKPVQASPVVKSTTHASTSSSKPAAAASSTPAASTDNQAGQNNNSSDVVDLLSF